MSSLHRPTRQHVPMEPVSVAKSTHRSSSRLESPSRTVVSTPATAAPGTPSAPNPPLPCPVVLISNAEGSKHLVNYPPLNSPGVGVLINLPSTDCVFYGNGDPNPPISKPTISVGVEVKSLIDLLTGFDDGRLFATQVPKLLAAHDVRYLVFYGVFRCSPSDGLTLQELKSHHYPNRQSFTRWSDVKLGSRSVRYGFLVSRLDKLSRLGVIHDHAPDMSHCGPAAPTIPDLTHVALWVGALARSYAKPYTEQTAAFHTFDNSRDSVPGKYDLTLDSTTKQIAKLVFSFPGIGWDRAFALAQHYASFLDICLASVESLAEVCTVSGDGRRVRFGMKLAESIHRTIRAKRP